MRNCSTPSCATALANFHSATTAIHPDTMHQTVNSKPTHNHILLFVPNNTFNGHHPAPTPQITRRPTDRNHQRVFAFGTTTRGSVPNPHAHFAMSADTVKNLGTLNTTACFVLTPHSNHELHPPGQHPYTHVNIKDTTTPIYNKATAINIKDTITPVNIKDTKTLAYNKAITIKDTTTSANIKDTTTPVNIKDTNTPVYNKDTATHIKDTTTPVNIKDTNTPVYNKDRGININYTTTPLYHNITPSIFTPLPTQATTPINIQEFKNCLDTHPDHPFVNYLIHGLSHGFDIGFAAEPTITRPRNLLSATDHTPAVTEALTKEVARGTYRWSIPISSNTKPALFSIRLQREKKMVADV